MMTKLTNLVHKIDGSSATASPFVQLSSTIQKVRNIRNMDTNFPALLVVVFHLFDVQSIVQVASSRRINGEHNLLAKITSVGELVLKERLKE